MTPSEKELLPSAHYARPPRQVKSSRVAQLRSAAVLVTFGALVLYILLGRDFRRYIRLRPQNDVGAETDADVWRSEGWFPSPRGGTVPSWKESYDKAAKMVSQMSLVEKVNVTSGVGWAMGLCAGNTAPAVNVGFPSLCLQDTTAGLRFADHATAWPAGLTSGATWNRVLMRERARLHGKETKGKGIHAILGPVVGPLGRLPAGGRNWEGFGSDPYLQGIMAAEYIKAIQAEGVIATVKHFIVNEQEHFRQVLEWEESKDVALSENVDDRTLHELYLWPFADAVKAGVGSVMCSYNQINNTYGCGNSKTMNGLLKDELGFQGFVQSDWYAERSGVEAILAGLDVCMPGNIYNKHDGESFFGSNLTAAVMNSTIPLERLDDMATRVVATWYQMGQDDPNRFPVQEGPNFSSWTDEEEGWLHHQAGTGPRGVVNKFVDVQEDHYKVARQVAVEGTVLLKNSGILPLDKSKYEGKAIGIYGEDAGDDSKPGFPNFCKDRGCNVGSLGLGWGSGAVDYEVFHTPQSALRKAFNTPKISAITDNNDLSSIKKSAKSQDLCFAFINADAGEGYIVDPVTGFQGDRTHLFAQKGGDDLVITVANACENTIVVMHSVGVIIVEKWIEHPNVKAVLMAHLPGQESGTSLVELLFGDANPSGKLPYTIGKSEDDYGPHSKILFHPNGPVPQQTFHERLEVDYRYFDNHDITPRFEFGFGLSYTTFDIHSATVIPVRAKSAFPPPRSDMLLPPTYDSQLPEVKDVVFPKNFQSIPKYIYPWLTSADLINSSIPLPYPDEYGTTRPLSPAGGGEGGNPGLWDAVVRVEVMVKNIGERDGQEVVQLYVEFPEVDGVPFPKRQLRGFEKVLLKIGEGKKVQLELHRRDLSYWDVVAQNWRMPTEGKFKLWVGRSSRDLPVVVEF